MKINVAEERLLVISDIHLGNSFFHADRELRHFLDMVADEGYNLCINGDGVDLLQTSLLRMTGQLSRALEPLDRLVRRGCRIYYTIGNHDIVLEHFIDDFSFLQVAPFLNLTSGDRRIRVEHGHLYDPIFSKHPQFYFWATRLGGMFLNIHPSLYHFHSGWKRAARFVRGRREKASESSVGIKGESPKFLEAVHELWQRGFDTVVFGHTHLQGQVFDDRGRSYYNTGSWFRRPHYLKIEHGEVELREWSRGSSKVVERS